ncbi:hypothetical protein LguiB_018843 [Lonicera macranthoides]
MEILLLCAKGGCGERSKMELNVASFGRWRYCYYVLNVDSLCVDWLIHWATVVTGTTLSRLGAPKVKPRRCQNNAWPAAVTNRERGLVDYILTGRIIVQIKMSLDLRWLQVGESIERKPFAIVALKKGAHLLKYGRRRKPKFCPFRLSTVCNFEKIIDYTIILLLIFLEALHLGDTS